MAENERLREFTLRVVILCSVHHMFLPTSRQCSTLLLQIHLAQTWLLHVQASLGHFQVRQRLSCKPGFYCCWNILLHPAGNCYTKTRSDVLNCSHCFPFGGVVFGVPAVISSGSSTQQSPVRQDRTNKHAELVSHTSHTITPKPYPLSSIACMQFGTNVHSSPAKCYKSCTL